jgi:hypothetical protein
MRAVCSLLRPLKIELTRRLSPNLSGLLAELVVSGFALTSAIRFSGLTLAALLSLAALGSDAARFAASGSQIFGVKSRESWMPWASVKALVVSGYIWWWDYV